MCRFLIGVFATIAGFQCSASIWTDDDGRDWRYRTTDDLFGAILYGDSYRGMSTLSRSVKGTVILPSMIIDEVPVVDIAQDAFYGCKYLTDIEVQPDNAYFTTFDGVLYDYDMTCLIRCPQGKTSVTIPPGVREIAAGAFAGCTKLIEIDLPDTLMYIRGDAFCGCTSIRQVEIPPLVVAIDAGAFSGCPNLTNIVFTGNAPSVMWFGRSSLPIENAFGQQLYYVQRTETILRNGMEVASGSSIVDEVTSIDSSSTSFKETTDEEGNTWTITTTKCASSCAAFEMQVRDCSYDPNLNFDQSRSCDAYDGYSVMSNYHRAAIYDFAGYSNADYPRTSAYLMQYVNSGSKGWNSNQEDSALPEYWCGRPLKYMGGKLEDDTHGEVAGQLVSLTITNVIVHYIQTSELSPMAAPITKDDGIVNVMTEIKGGNISIPESWATNWPSFKATFGSDFSDALIAETGKFDAGGKPMYVWQDYVAGTDPTDKDDVFKASVTIVEGVPVISYTPTLSDAEAAKRKYTTFGKVKLQDEDWVEVPAGHEADYNFFKVTVEMK